MARLPELFSDDAYTQGRADILDLAGLTDPDNQIKKVSGLKFINANQLINYCDSIKDAIGIRKDNRLFYDTLYNLYSLRDIVAWDKQLAKELLDIHENLAYGTNVVTKVSFMRKITESDIKNNREVYKPTDENPFNNLPLNVTHAVQDSGYGPQELNPKMIVVINPGSYIDPASRLNLSDKGTMKYSGSVDESIFKSLGFADAVKSFDGRIDLSGTMTCQLNLVESSEIYTTSYTNIYTHSGVGTDYFASGNPTKNAWFNNNSTSQIPGIKKEAIKYALFKELGDTLQVVYAKLMMGAETNLGICMFTVDKTVRGRCRELRVPVCYQDHAIKEFAGLGLTDYYPNAQVDPKVLFPLRKQQMLENTVNSNQSVINSITRFITSTNSLNQSSKDFLLSITISIHAVSELLRTTFSMPEYNSTESNEENERRLEALQLLSIACTAKDCIDVDAEQIPGRQDTDYILSQFLVNITYLFTLSSTFPLVDYDVIRKTHVSLIEHMRTLLSNAGEDRLQLRQIKREEAIRLAAQKALAKKAARGGDPNNTMSDEASTATFMFKYYSLVYTIVSEILDGEEESLKKDIAFSFVNTSYIYFKYIGASCLEEDILEYFIFIFITEGFKDLTLERFKSLYDSFEIVQLEKIAKVIYNSFLKINSEDVFLEYKRRLNSDINGRKALQILENNFEYIRTYTQEPSIQPPHELEEQIEDAPRKLKIQSKVPVKQLAAILARRNAETRRKKIAEIMRKNARNAKIRTHRNFYSQPQVPIGGRRTQKKSKVRKTRKNKNKK